MIVIIDDEKWSIEGYLDVFESKQTKNDRYKYEFFYTPLESKPFINNNIESIDLIILDIMLDYGDNAQNNENEVFENGGIEFLRELREDSSYDKIPIIIYSIVDKGKLESYLEYKNVFYLNRDCSDDEFYDLVAKCLRI